MACAATGGLKQVRECKRAAETSSRPSPQFLGGREELARQCGGNSVVGREQSSEGSEVAECGLAGMLCQGPTLGG